MHGPQEDRRSHGRGQLPCGMLRGPKLHNVSVGTEECHGQHVLDGVCSQGAYRLLIKKRCLYDIFMLQHHLLLLTTPFSFAGTCFRSSARMSLVNKKNCLYDIFSFFQQHLQTTPFSFSGTCFHSSARMRPRGGSRADATNSTLDLLLPRPLSPSLP